MNRPAVKRSPAPKPQMCPCCGLAAETWQAPFIDRYGDPGSTSCLGCGLTPGEVTKEELPEHVEQHRQEWLRAGGEWWAAGSFEPPAGWDPAANLRAIGCVREAGLLARLGGGAAAARKE